MDFIVEEPIVLEDGTYTGTITKIDYRTTPYDYTDIIIEEDKTGIALKYGCPSKVSEKTKLGRLLSNFTKLVIGEQVSPNSILINHKITFEVLNVPNKRGDGTFVRIKDDSIKPILV